MADKKNRFIDVWIVESNTVYKDVPYMVVTDWVQQGRLLEDDRVRPSGTPDWFRLGELPAFAAFVPKAEPYRATDEAEALESIHTDFNYKRSHADEDDDVDMIPLIDISLVLLIFFMMTAAVGGAGSLIETPAAKYMHLTIEPEMIWIGMQPNKAGAIDYSLGKGESSQGVEVANREALISELDKMLQEQKGTSKLSIRAHHKTPYDAVRDMTIELERFRRSGKVVEVYGEVRESEAR